VAELLLIRLINPNRHKPYARMISQTLKKRITRRKPEKLGSRPFFVFFVSSWSAPIFNHFHF